MQNQNRVKKKKNSRKVGFFCPHLESRQLTFNWIIIIFFYFLATTTECDLCNKNGKCILDDSAVVRCECRPWFAGRNCQINLKLLLIVGCVSVILMIVIACGVSCFCCRDRNSAKDNIPCKQYRNLNIMIFFFGFLKIIL